MKPVVSSAPDLEMQIHLGRGLKGYGPHHNADVLYISAAVCQTLALQIMAADGLSVVKG